MDIGDESAYGKDMKILWAAYKAGSFEIKEGLSQDQFADLIIGYLSAFDSVFIVEDKNGSFDGRGPVAAVLVVTDGGVIRPSVEFFKWASKRNRLRSVVAFLQWVRYSKDVGVCVFGSTVSSKNLFDRMREYGILVWHIGNGYFGIAGKKCA